MSVGLLLHRSALLDAEQKHVCQIGKSTNGSRETMEPKGDISRDIFSHTYEGKDEVITCQPYK